MEALEGDFHDGGSSFDEILDFDNQESHTVKYPRRKVDERESFYRSLDEY